MMLRGEKFVCAGKIGVYAEKVGESDVCAGKQNGAGVLFHFLVSKIRFSGGIIIRLLKRLACHSIMTIPPRTNSIARG